MSRNQSNIFESHEKSSVASTKNIIQRHIDIDWKVDFEKCEISGSVSIIFDVLHETNKVDLDIRSINIISVESLSADGNNQPAFTISDANLIEETYKSSRLAITFPKPLDKSSRLVLKISYVTSPEASGLQWLKKQATKDQVEPYLFSQFQAIHARSVVPCQDIPDAKVTYNATVQTQNSKQICLMSALKDDKAGKPTDKIDNIYRFYQPVNMPTYLIAIVVGHLDSRDIGPRSRVWAEPSMVEASAYEFAETEQFIKTAEDIVGPYVWGRYDLLVLPPTFPYGGMENPCLTFVTPTLLAGDRSLANVVAHEIAHSWTGNLVGCKTWEHFWLNEGHTVFLERKIGLRLYGEEFWNLANIEGTKALSGSIEAFGADNLLTAMVPELKNVDPDDAFSSVPYEKGCGLLTLIEQKIGGRAVMEPWFKSYVNEYSYKTTTSGEWKDFLYSYFPDKRQVLDEIDWEMWFHQSGMPEQMPTFDATLENECIQIAKSWKEDSNQANSHNKAEYDHLNTLQKIILFGHLEKDESLTRAIFKTITTTYEMEKVGNSEIKFQWIMFGLRTNDEQAFKSGEAMVREQGRMKFTRPLFKSMNKMNREETIKVFNDIKQFMHPTTAAMVSKDLGLDS